jgi:hypothetical protein
VVDATRHADAALTDEVWAEALATFYSHENISCVARELDGKVVPFLSLFGRMGISAIAHPGFRRTGLIPSGVYYEVKEHHTGLLWWVTDIDYWGYSGGGTNVRFPHWLKGVEDE